MSVRRIKNHGKRVWQARGMLLALVMPTAGCATVEIDRDFDPALFESFTPGKTTATDVRAAAGEPWLRQKNPDRSETWTYLSSKSEARAIPLFVYTHMKVQGQTKSVTPTFRDGVRERLVWPHPSSPEGGNRR